MITNWEVNATKSIGYRVRIIRNLINPDNPMLAHACGADGIIHLRRLVVIDQNVYDLYRHEILSYFLEWKITPIWKILPGAETSKTIGYAMEVVEAMTQAELLRRQDVVVAIGGGVVLDIAGFAASLFRRGIPYLRIPTTLMGQIDAGIGIKTGVNTGFHKNRIGTYFPSISTFIDPAFLVTLPPRHLANGLAEIIKMGLVRDKLLFNLLEDEANKLCPGLFISENPLILEILSRAISGMLDELRHNLWETVLERAVDFGHTFSPTLELRADPPLLHGEAVAVDMVLSLALAHNRGLLLGKDFDRAIMLIAGVGLPVDSPTFSLTLAEAALRDAVQHRDGLQRVPLTQGIGRVHFVNDLSTDELAAAMALVRRSASTLVPRAEAV